MNHEDNKENNVIAWFRALYQALAGTHANRSWCDCLDLANAIVPDPEFQRVVRGVADVVKLGFPLSLTMEMFPKVFSPDHVAVIRYGEMYGEVDLTLERYVERPEDRASRCPVSPSG